MVDPRWLLRAFVLALVVAAVLAYLALCLLVYLGSSRMILHPSPVVDRTPASISLPFEQIRFDSAATGTPRLTGWWVPAATLQPQQAPVTILLLHDGRGSLTSTLPLIALLHQASASVFAIDYRGFGASSLQRPDEERMEQDSAAALAWLTSTRHVPASSIVPFGNGLGAVLAAHMAATNPSLPALIVDNPDLVTVGSLEDDPRARLLPMHLLLADRFDLATPLNAVTRPRLLIVGGAGDTTPARDRSSEEFFKSVPGPHWVVELPPAAESETSAQMCPSCPGPAYVATVRRFLDENVPLPAKSEGKP